MADSHAQGSGQGSGKMNTDVFETHMIVTLGRKTALVPVVHEPEGEDGPDFLILLDDVTHWQAPHADEDISLEDLAKITELIERDCEKLGLDVEFE